MTFSIIRHASRASSFEFSSVRKCNIGPPEYTAPTTQAMKATYSSVMTHNQALHQSCSSMSLSPRALSRFARDYSLSYRVLSTSCSSNVKCILTNHQRISSTQSQILENTDISGALRLDRQVPVACLSTPTHFTLTLSNNSSHAHTSQHPDHTTLPGFFSSPILSGPHGAALFCPLHASTTLTSTRWQH